MKSKVSLFLSLTLCITGSLAFAEMIAPTEPPAQYIEKLQTCTPSYHVEDGPYVKEYRILGKLPDGRCQVSIKSRPNYLGPKYYKDMANFYKLLYHPNETNVSETEIRAYLKQAESDLTQLSNCRFSPQQVTQIKYAYSKHDGKPQPSPYQRDANGNITGFKSSYSTGGSNLSSYENLMSKYYSGTCTLTHIKQNKQHR